MSYVAGIYIRVLSNSEVLAAESKPTGNIWAPETPGSSDRDDLDQSELEPIKLVFNHLDIEDSPDSELSNEMDTASTILDQSNGAPNTDAYCAENHKTQQLSSVVLVSSQTKSIEKSDVSGLVIPVVEEVALAQETVDEATTTLDSLKDLPEHLFEEVAVYRGENVVPLDPVTVTDENEAFLQKDCATGAPDDSGCAKTKNKLLRSVFKNSAPNTRKKAQFPEYVSLLPDGMQWRSDSGVQDLPTKITLRKCPASAIKRSADSMINLPDCSSVRQPAAKTATMERLLHMLESRNQQNENLNRVVQGLVSFMFNSPPSGLVDYDPFKLPVSNRVAHGYDDRILRPQSLTQLAGEISSGDDNDLSYVWKKLRIMAVNTVAFNFSRANISNQARSMLDYVDALQKETESVEFKDGIGLENVPQKLTQAARTRDIWERIVVHEEDEMPITL